MNKLQKKSVNIHKKLGLGAVAALTVVGAVLGLGSGLATADKLECNSERTIHDRGDGKYTCWGPDKTIYAFPSQEASAETSAHDVARSRERGVAGGGTSITRVSAKYQPSVRAMPTDIGLGFDSKGGRWSEILAMFVHSR
ncbi:MAG: hypothetical protein WAW80_03835 [Candidatus Saccharimonadales bacterium]